MTTPQLQSPPPAETAAPVGKALRRLFLTLFLRGRSSRGLQKETAPKSIAHKLIEVMVMYALVGLLALGSLKQSVFALSIFLHSMTFVFLGMFVAGSAGEVLFNKEEAEILLHRPILPRLLLWAKVRMLAETSLWLAGAFNLAGLFVGVFSSDGGWLFPIAHALSTSLEALFCTALVVLVYQFSLRWFGRERLDALMTATQVLVAVAAVLAGQILPRLVFLNGHAIHFTSKVWWIGLAPPAWFAGIDDALAGSRQPGSWILAACGLVATAIVLALAFGRLANAYETGLQNLGETASRKFPRRGSRLLDNLVNLPPLRWWMPDPVSRQSFLLTTRYLLRDRDIKLRVYPGLAPMLVVPFIFLFQERGQVAVEASGFGVAFIGAYLGMVPLMGVTLLQYSQQWQATDIFRAAPLTGPGPVCDGARRAVLLFLALPMGTVFILVAWLMKRDAHALLLLLPGILALPIYAIWPHLGGRAVPLSVPPEEAKSAGRSLTMFLVMLIAVAISGAGLIARKFGLFWWLVAVESVVVLAVYYLMRKSLAAVRWTSME